MKHFIYILTSVLLLAAVSCDGDESSTSATDPTGQPGNDGPAIPEGWFVATFTAGADTRTPITGTDTRVQHLRYMVFDIDNLGSFVKERVIPITSGGQQWPLPLPGGVMRDTLPAGTYIAVFLANADPSLFAYGGSEPFELLTGYQDGYTSARIHMPPVEFTSDTEYYLATAAFSEVQPSADILLQRIIGRTKLKRITVDAQDALNTLVRNLLTELDYETVLGNTVASLLGDSSLLGQVSAALGLDGVFDPLGALDSALSALLNPILQSLVDPITTVLYDLLIGELVNHIGGVLELNTDGGGLAYLTSPLLNPWGTANASSTLVTISNFPEAVDFNLAPTDFFPPSQRFKYDFNTLDPEQEHYITIKGFGGDYDVEKINVLSNESLIGGIVVNEVVDDFLLTGTFIDVDDPTTIPQATNRSIQNNYSLLAINIKDNTASGDSYNFQLNTTLGQIANLDDVVYGVVNEGLVGGLVDLVDALLTVVGTLSFGVIDLSISDLLNAIVGVVLDIPINIDLPVALPLLDTDNLSLSGSWGEVEPWNGD